MKDLLMPDGKPANDLSKRMADNVVQTLVIYMQAPSAVTAEAVHAYSTALSSLSLLAIAEQLQALNVALGSDEVADGSDAAADDEGEYSYWPGDPLIKEIVARRNGSAA